MFPSNKKVTLLVAEASSLIIASMSRTIKKLGYDVITADNGDACLELLNTLKIEVLLLHTGIPGKNSFEILSYVHDHFPDLPVIMIADSMSESDEAQSFTTGAFDYLIKPVNGVRLEVTIKKAITESERRRHYLRNRCFGFDHGI